MAEESELTYDARENGRIVVMPKGILGLWRFDKAEVRPREQ